MKSFRYKSFKFQTWHFVVPVMLVIIIVVGGPVLKLLKSLFGSLNFAGSKVLAELGLSQKNDEQVRKALTDGVQNPWSPKFSQESGGSEWHFTSDEVRFNELIKRVHSCQSFMGGINMDKYIDLFNDFGSQLEFSSFCWWWEKKEGTNLASWMQSGWLFGLVSSMGDTDFLQLDKIIHALPKNP